MVAAMAGAVGGAVFLGLAALHVHWARGGTWPESSPERLSRLVVGVLPGEGMPGRAACWAVAGALAGAAWVVLSASGVAPELVPRGWARVAALLGAGILLLRGLGGFVEHRLRPSIVGSRYEVMNRALYSPLCVALSLCAALSALG